MSIFFSIFHAPVFVRLAAPVAAKLCPAIARLEFVATLCANHRPQWTAVGQGAGFVAAFDHDPTCTKSAFMARASRIAHFLASASFIGAGAPMVVQDPLRHTSNAHVPMPAGALP
jgi:hypothetical protein